MKLVQWVLCTIFARISLHSNEMVFRYFEKKIAVTMWICVILNSEWKIYKCKFNALQYRV